MKLAITLSILFSCMLHSIIVIADVNYTWERVVIRSEPDTYYYGGSFVERADGKILVTYLVGSKVMLSYVDTEKEFLSINNASAKNELEFYSLYSSGAESDARLQRLSNGNILLYIMEHGVVEDSSKPFRLVLYESVNGLGTDFTLKSIIYELDMPAICFGSRKIGQAIEFGGRIFLPLAAPVMVHGGAYDGTETSRLYCAISSDGGLSWQFSQIATDNGYRGASRGFGIADNQIFLFVHNMYAAGVTTLLSHQLSSLFGGALIIENQPSWEYDEGYSQQHLGDMLFSHIFWQPDGYNYMLRERDNRLYEIYRHSDTTSLDLTGQAPYETGSIGSGATWEGPLNESFGDEGKEFFSVTPSGHLAVFGTSTFGGSSVSHLYVGRVSVAASSLAAQSAIRFLLLNSN